MQDNSNSSISSLDMFFIINGTVVGVGVLSVANSQIKICYQDGWISMLLGGIYPIIIVLLGNYLIKKYPKDNVLVLNDRFFGRFIGGILNFIFGSYFFMILVFGVCGAANVFRVYGIAFIKPLKFIGLAVFVGGWAAHKGLRVLAKINIIGFIISIVFIVSIIPGSFKGTYTNILPVFQMKTTDLMKAMIQTFYSYSGAEVLMLFHPYIRDKNKIRKNSLISVLIIIFMYIIVTISTIFYYGPEIAPKSMWSLIDISKSIEIPILNNFRFILVCMIIIISLKIIVNYYFCSSVVVQHIFKIKKMEYIIMVLYPIIVYLAMKLTNEIFRRKVSDTIFPYYIIFVLVMLITIAIITAFKKKG
ncbi:GerAB/ArcD/ProY family transporter [Clostridium ganghwense]|uniref:GerAB/ArcD/ProY family transporter n=1 Tax=Clostridium ganghwense TaxID=312089 RepID=A0ABT4CRL0_9CLOT|nr:GerAB/ArcD/ProY family transporter [Clostridium ganghwense]MCY6371704.1 GerAB/ArcD/ProY family transporter [Clostridium ganghwense]